MNRKPKLKLKPKAELNFSKAETKAERGLLFHTERQQAFQPLLLVVTNIGGCQFGNNNSSNSYDEQSSSVTKQVKAKRKNE